MPRIFDNISENQILLDALRETLTSAYRADFCVGYFNLRGWRAIADEIDGWQGDEDSRCRVLIGMQQRPEDEFRAAMQGTEEGEYSSIDNATANRQRKRLAEELREQLTIGSPSNADEAALRKLARQLRQGKVVVKLYLRHKLHAKLYLLYRHDVHAPIVGYLGSSNLTFAGLKGQGELNIDVVDSDAAQKLAAWFDDRWDDRWCIDISAELADIIEESWARPDLIPPYHIYVKMAYHLSQEARTGITEFTIPHEFQGVLFPFQEAAVKVAAHHLNRRGGVLIGDVVGLGKTVMATALARVFEEDFGINTLILCPKNLVKMWQEDYVERYGLRAKVLSITRAGKELPNLRRYRLVIIDESHNLRNREGKRYRAIAEYLSENDSLCVLLSATPYNKTYLDLSSQLRLFVPEDKDLGIRPEQLLREIGETEFVRRHQAGLRTLAAFEQSTHADDWRELMRLYMVRRTRSFIKQNYAEKDPDTGRTYLTFSDGTRSYFPDRTPRTLKFPLDEAQDHNQYAQLYADPVVAVINDLELPRYGLAQYLVQDARLLAQPADQVVLENLSRAGKRLMGFCRTNLFKRLESSGMVFLQSLERHILRNYVYLHAIEKGLPLPIGTQDAAMLDTRTNDQDVDDPGAAPDLFNQDEDEAQEGAQDGAEDDGDSLNVQASLDHWSDEAFRRRAAEVYETYRTDYQSRFKWLSAALFKKTLARHLAKDAEALTRILQECGDWRAAEDAKLDLLASLVNRRHRHEKVIVFTQFADTVAYLERELARRGVSAIAGVTGNSADPTALAHRFSPQSNPSREPSDPSDELRVLIATDVLSEGQNLQDCAVVVNYDLPWAIIRLIQRAGRVDRIGQRAARILCYTFLPAEGVERIIRLRQRVRQRLTENAEVVGTDEAFFEDDMSPQNLVDLYNEQAGLLDEDEDSEVDLASYAYQIWQNAIREDPGLEKTIPALSDVSFSARAHDATPQEPEGVLVYLRTAAGNDVLAWAGHDGRVVSESQFAILNAARCAPDTPALERAAYHHDAVRAAIRHVSENQHAVTAGGQLGRPSGARFRTYERLQRFAEGLRNSLFSIDYEKRGLYRAIEDIYRYPLRQAATDVLNRQLRAGIRDEELAELVMNLRAEERLCIISEDTADLGRPQIICSMGLITSR